MTQTMRNFLRFLLITLCLGVSLAHAAPAASTPGTGAPSVPDLRLGAGDMIRVTVYQNPDLTMDLRLSEGGMVSYPLLGPLKIGGLSVPEAEALIRNGLRNGGFVKDPQVTLILTQVRGSQISVLGQVNRPGRYPLEQAQMRLSDVLALAGGIVVTAGSDVVTVVGTRNGKPMRVEVDVPLIFAPGAASSDMLLMNNDVVWVERAPMVYVYGEVQRPGTVRLERDMTVMQALAASGGLTQRGTERGIRVHRRNASTDKTDVLQPGLNDRLRSGDVVYVRESLF